MSGVGRAAVALVTVLAAAAVAAGCAERSRVDPEAAVVVRGSVRAPDGTPLAGRAVRLGGGVGTDEGVLAALTLGLACTTGACTGAVSDATTAADGSYRFDLTGRDTRSTFGQALSQLVSVSAPPGPGQVSGAAASARFLVQVPDVQLPPLDLVDPGLVVEGGTEVAARWAPARPGPYELTFEEASAVPVWRVAAGDATASVDPRVLEDTSGRVVVSGGSVDRVEGSEVALRWRSPGVGYAAAAGPPPSRGRACRVVDRAGTLRPVPGGCPATDGDLVGEGTPTVPCPEGAPACGPAAGVVVDLGAPVPAELVVVRGCAGGCAVEVSADGTAFRPAGAAAEGFGTVALDGRPVTSVRVGYGTGSGLREVSVWGPRPPAAGLRPVGAEAGDLRRSFAGADPAGGGDGVPVALGVLAAALAAASLAGAGFAAGRRRRG